MMAVAARASLTPTQLMIELRCVGFHADKTMMIRHVTGYQNVRG